MQIINNTTGNVHWDTSYVIDGKSGGDCGDIPAGGMHDYPISVKFNINFVSTAAYHAVDPSMMLIISSQLEDGSADRAEATE